MKFLEQFTPDKEMIEKMVSIMTENFDNDTLIIEELSEKTISDYQQYTIGFTISDSKVKMIITYITNYVNELNFKLETYYFVLVDDNMYPLSIFQYPDGSVSENLFANTDNYLSKYFNEENE